MKRMELFINHQITFFETLPSSLEEIVLRHTEDNTSGIAVALNQVVIPKSKWLTTTLAPHDHVLIIRATQGG